MPKRKNNQPAETVSAPDLLQLFKRAKKPLTLAELLKGLRLHKSLRGALQHALNGLLEQGKIIRLGRDAYGLLDEMNLLTGRLEMQRSGVGFVILDDKRRKDIFISPGNLGDAWHGDRVAVSVLPVRDGRRQSGRIARVLERKTTTLPVRVSRLHAGSVLCQPTDPTQRISVVVDRDSLPSKPRPGDVLLVTPTEQIEQNLWLADLDRMVGREDDPAAQEELVKLGKGVPTVFPEEVLAEAEKLPTDPDESDWAPQTGRRDLRELDFVTIDGAKARDFDDAILVATETRGFRLWVAIADVSHYAHPDSALDQQAMERGNSYYFPQSVEPMFPERLSNGLCSLKPDVPRLVMVAELGLDAHGVIREDDASFYPAVIRSKARLTYGQVKKALIDKDETERAGIAHVLPMLEQAERLARLIHGLRRDRGSLDFDLPEPEILFNLDGEAVDITPKVRHFGHQIIEEFMITANEAVARFLTDRDMPCLYRAHEAPDPDKLESLFKTLSATDLGPSLPARRFNGEAPSPEELQKVLRAAEGTEQEYLASRLLLRSMMQAKYTPELGSHYGLASSCYCHFTSPIRRYADLVVHRSLKSALAPESHGAQRPKGLKKLGDHLCERERMAMDAEREILKRITVLFLQEKVGEEYTGIISGLSDFGFWVELKEVMAEGLVRLSSLNDDYYALVSERQELRGERTGASLRLGQAVAVRLTDVNLARLEVNLELLTQPSQRGKAKRAAPKAESAPASPRKPARQTQKVIKSKGQTSNQAQEKSSGKAPKKIPSLFSE
jgi:ribonuclease R